jgi:hypothetical protein
MWVTLLFLFNYLTSCLASTCLGPPYILATFHGGSSKSNINQVQQFSRDGCLLNDQVLGTDQANELRGMALTEQGQLVVNNAYKQTSAVLLFDNCNAQDSTRAYNKTITGTLTDDDANKDYYLIHPYGAAVYNSRVYVTNQDSCTITSYALYGNTPDEKLLASFYPCNVLDCKCTIPHPTPS